MGNEADPRQGEVRFEPTDVPSLLPLWLAAGLGGCLAIVLIVVALGYPLADRPEYHGPHRPLPPSPRLELAPGADLAHYRSTASKKLQTANVPIEVAMRTTAREGWGPPR